MNKIILNKKIKLIAVSSAAMIIILTLSVGLGVGLTRSGSNKNSDSNRRDDNLITENLSFTTSEVGSYGNVLNATLSASEEALDFSYVTEKNLESISLNSSVLGNEPLSLSVHSGYDRNQQIMLQSTPTGIVVFVPISPVAAGSGSTADTYYYAELRTVENGDNYILAFTGLSVSYDPQESNTFLTELTNSPSINITFALRN